MYSRLIGTSGQKRGDHHAQRMAVVSSGQSRPVLATGPAAPRSAAAGQAAGRVPGRGGRTGRAGSGAEKRELRLRAGRQCESHFHDRRGPRAPPGSTVARRGTGVLDGEPVLLCWLEGESALSWYHKAAHGFAGRRRIPG